MISETDKAKIRKANTANIVRKVKAGKPLTSAELKLIDAQTSQEPTTGDEPTEQPQSKPKLTAEKARAMIERNAVNLAAKVASGETLKGGELAIMQQIAASADVTLGVEWVKNQTALAALLGTTRRTINRWAKVDGVPKPAADGRHNVPAWREWMKNNGHVVKDGAHAGGRMAELKERQLERSVEILEVKLAELRGDVIAVSTVEAMLSEFGATIMAMLRQKLENEFPISCAGLEPAQVRVRGKALVDDIAGRLRAAVDPWRNGK